MKKIFCAGVISALICGNVMADGVYVETETVTTWENVDVVVEAAAQPRRYYSSRDVRPMPRPCAKKVADPVRVKTHTEVIDHYQVYQPVTVYKPMGTQIQRRVVPVVHCNKCGM